MTASWNGSPSLNLTLRAGLPPTRSAKPTTAAHLRTKYHREAVRAARWSAAPGQALINHYHFKINELHSPNCQISLALTGPAANLLRLVPQVDVTLVGKTLELNKWLVQTVLVGWADERWLRFLQMVRPSKLSSSATPPDNDLVSAIRQVLD